MLSGGNQAEEWGNVAGKTIVIYLIPSIFGYFFGLTVFFILQVITVITIIASTDVTAVRMSYLGSIEEDLKKDEERIRNEKERLEIEKEILEKKTTDNKKDKD